MSANLFEMREQFPKAWGSLPKADGNLPSEKDLWKLVSKGITDSRIRVARVDGRSTGWLQDPSTRKTLFFTAFMMGDMAHKHGPELALSHVIGVGHRTVHDLPLIPVREAAVPAVGHDTEEESTKRGHDRGSANLFIAQHCFEGSSQRKLLVWKDLNDHTDDPAIKDRNERLAQQAHVIRYGSLTLITLKGFKNDKIEQNEYGTHKARSGKLTRAQLEKELKISESKIVVLDALLERGMMSEKEMKRYRHNENVMRGILARMPQPDHPTQMPHHGRGNDLLLTARL